MQDRPVSKDIGDVLTIGFGTSVAMWAVGYFSRLPGVVAPGWVVFALMILCMVAGGVAAGVLTARRGWEPGLVTAIVNLLVLGSLLGKESGELRQYAALWLCGAIGVTLLCVMLGALVGRVLRRGDVPATNWPAALAGVTAVATVLLLIVGGNVTGFKAGMAVPDWPTTFKVNMFLYPLTRMTGGIYFEHAHRLFGSLVGLTTLVLAIYVRRRETRGWVRALVWILFVAIVVQGLAGGFRVTENNLTLATIHGVFAQVCLSAMVVLTLVLSNTWRERRNALTHTHIARDRTWGTLAVLAIFTQVTLGAIYRHFGEGLYVHVGFALVALVACGGFAFRCWGIHESVPLLTWGGAVVLATLSLQLLLGFAALGAVLSEQSRHETTVIQVVLTTLHQTTGALLLATTTALYLANLRLVRPAPRQVGELTAAAH